MATKRRKIAARQISISPAAVEAWRAGAWMELHRALGLKPWECSPLDVDDDGEVMDLPLIAAPPEHRGFQRAARLRQSLIALAGEPGKVQH